MPCSVFSHWGILSVRSLAMRGPPCPGQPAASREVPGTAASRPTGGSVAWLGGRRSKGFCQPAYKPGSVWRVAPPRRPFIWDAACAAPRATNPGGGRDRAWNAPSTAPSVPRRPYSVLLPVGFAVPPPSPEARCALTAPFHPCPCGLPRAGGLISVALSLGSPPAAVSRHRQSLEPGLSSTARLGRQNAGSRGSGRPAG